MLKDIVDENICRKGIEKETIANLQKQKKIHFMRKYLFYICLEVVSNFFC
jgi:hypothetical protein